MNTFLFCATDAGGAKNLVPLIKLTQWKGSTYVVFSSETSQRIFHDNNIPTQMANIKTVEQAKIILRERNPSIVVCGTTSYEAIDRLLIAVAKQLGIKTMVVLDEWFNYRMRFEDQKGALVYLPDMICCQDDKARQEAIEEGIPAQHLVVTGSPYLTVLTNEAEKFYQQPPSLPTYIAPDDAFTLTFLSETHALDHGVDDRGGPLGDYLGYSELTVREDIFNIVNEIEGRITVIEKLHPKDERSFKPLNNNRIRWEVTRDADLWPLLWHSDVVIGMRSMSLLEAAILGCRVVSYQPNLKIDQLCTAVRLNLIECIKDKENLKAWIKQNLKEKKKDPLKEIRRFPFAKTETAEGIYQLAINS